MIWPRRTPSPSRDPHSRGDRGPLPLPPGEAKESAPPLSHLSRREREGPVAQQREGEGVRSRKESASALYDGAVVHQRLAPRRHRLRYRLFQLLVDLDEAPALDRKLRLFGYNRPALFRLDDRDHGDGRPLKSYARHVLREAGIEANGAIRLLTMPRVLGYVFNPLSIFYCHRPDGALAAVLLEVNNTFGERHTYVVETRSDAAGVVRASCAKTFFVSPFLGLDMTYDLRLALPGERIATSILARSAGGDAVLAASFTGRRAPLTDGALAAAFCRHPLLTLKVVAGIHWEALKLIAKGVRLRRRPPPPTAPVTVRRAAHLRRAA